jgi:hypothetical protein
MLATRKLSFAPITAEEDICFVNVRACLIFVHRWPSNKKFNVGDTYNHNGTIREIVKVEDYANGKCVTLKD